MVYVDPLFDTPRTFGHNRWCHMFADTVDELHAMAEKIGMKRQWFQDKPFAPHYDLVPRRRAMAVKHGAIEADARELCRRKIAAMRAAEPFLDDDCPGCGWPLLEDGSCSNGECSMGWQL